jgi:hypothetical protein
MKYRSVRPPEHSGPSCCALFSSSLILAPRVLSQMFYPVLPDASVFVFEFLYRLRQRREIRTENLAVSSGVTRARKLKLAFFLGF